MPLNPIPDDWDEDAFDADAHNHIGGRPPVPDHLKRKRRIVWLTDGEWELARPLLAALKAARPPVPKKARPQDSLPKRPRAANVRKTP